MSVERAAWTEERLDDLAKGMREGFARVDADIRELRTEVRGLGTEQRASHDALGAELRAEIEALRQTMIRVGGGMVVGFISVLAAILARGA